MEIKLSFNCDSKDALEKDEEDVYQYKFMRLQNRFSCPNTEGFMMTIQGGVIRTRNY